MIKLFCMQRDEDDILEEWILYHGGIFGFNNLHIIDNNSIDNSRDILKRYERFGVNVRHSDDYKHKGEILRQWAQETNADIMVPIDIDEFIICDDLRCDADSILKEFDLPKYNKYAFKSIYLSTLTSLPIKNPILELIDFVKLDYGDLSKKFFTTSSLVHLDHGHHHGIVSGDSSVCVSNLALLHYHSRSIAKFASKSTNDIISLQGADANRMNDVEYIKHISSLPRGDGYHKLINYIRFLQSKTSILSPPGMIELTGVSDSVRRSLSRRFLLIRASHSQKLVAH